MSYNPDSIESGEPFSASQGSTSRSSQNPQTGWTPSELKHQSGGNTAPQNTIEVLPKGTHLPPDRTFLPQNAERNVPAETRQDAVGTGLTNAELRQIMGGATSRTVHRGLGLPGDQSQAGESSLGDGGGKKIGGGLGQHSDGGLQGTADPKYDPGKEYVGNSREEKEYRGQGDERRKAIGELQVFTK